MRQVYPFTDIMAGLRIDAGATFIRIERFSLKSYG
jgi:hypothetical protein